jgi:hypothetical protein
MAPALSKGIEAQLEEMFVAMVLVDRRVLFPVAAGLIGFGIHALLFFSGAFLYVQLATHRRHFRPLFVLIIEPESKEKP